MGLTKYGSGDGEILPEPGDVKQPQTADELRALAAENADAMPPADDPARDDG